MGVCVWVGINTRNLLLCDWLTYIQYI